MSVIFDSNAKTFKLNTPNTSYMIYISRDNFLYHLYYGNKIPETDLRAVMRLDPDFRIGTAENGINNNLMFFPLEYPTYGIGNFLEPCLAIKDKDGNETCDLRYVSHTISEGKKRLEGLPASFAKEKSGATTLEIVCSDSDTNLTATLSYTVFENSDVIARSVRLTNNSTDQLVIKRALSGSFEIPKGDYDMITLPGGWARERHIERYPVRHGQQIISSKEGKTGHAMNNFFAVCSPDTTETAGEIYGCSLVYSGNFYAGADRGESEGIRVFSGISPLGFEWKLSPDETFQTPELLTTFSSKGLGEMSRSFHDFMREHLIRSRYIKAHRPILINNWEATYFDFNAEKLLSIAACAADCGIEMLVMDDGWFGHRSSDGSSLGDWTVWEEKLGCGLKELVDRVNALGLKFGIWFEPEMISPDSDLYRAHPDWCLHVGDRPRNTGRRQLVLDFSRKDVRYEVYRRMKKILGSANIEYIKWDHNRPLSEIGSASGNINGAMSVAHRYMLGVYELQERLITDYPDLLLENCSGGGGRFDAGMLHYSPQIWTSDNCDAYDRLDIQEGTSLCYPPLVCGSHICADESHIAGRRTSMETRAAVAYAGTFGYELDITGISESEKSEIRKQVDFYKKIEPLVLFGDYYRLSPAAPDRDYYAWSFVSKDKSECLFEYVRIHSRGSRKLDYVRLQGLDPAAQYRDDTGLVLSGSLLMNHGIACASDKGDYQCFVRHFKIV